MDPVVWLIVLVILSFTILISSYLAYNAKNRKKHSRECFDAMLRMLLQPTQINIEALEKILSKNRLNQKLVSELLSQAEMEADCISIMPTGELRSKQPFLEKRYSQILNNASNYSSVTSLIKTRLSQFWYIA